MTQPARLYHPPPPFLVAPVRPWQLSPQSPEGDGTRRDVMSRRLKKVLRLLADREKEALKLYEPVPGAVSFHASPAKTRIVIGSNRSSKTMSTAAELAMRMLGCHPTYKTPSRGIKVYGLGQDMEHVGKSMWPKLGHPGQFKIIPDEQTGKWRVVRPDNEYDKAYSEKWRDAPPLLPERLIKDIAWEAKNKGIPRTIKLKNGSSLTFYTSNGPARRGFDIDGAWADEEQDEEQWLYELYRGLTDRNGWFLYSATPQSGTHWLFEKYKQATSPFNDGSRIAAFKLLVRDNPFIQEEAKQTILDGITDERERRIRWDGEFALDERIVYPEFNRADHVLTESFWPGEDWNRYLIVDPGINVAAVEFIAVAPDTDDDGNPHPHCGEVHVYDELYLRRCGAHAVAKKVAERIDADPFGVRSGQFVAFIIDGRAARQTQMGSGRTIESDFRDAFRELGLVSRLTGSSFMRGSDNVEAREESLHRMLQRLPGQERPTLQVHPRCRSLIWEFPLQTRKKDKSGLVLKERERRDDHAISVLEYFSDYHRGWMYFPPPPSDGNRIWREFQKRKKRRDSGVKVRLGPPV